MPPSRRMPPSRMTAALPRTLEKLPSSASSPALQWLPPSRLEGLPAGAVGGAEDMVMASWLNDFGGKSQFGSPAVFIELQLRQALTATQSTQGKPDAFRTACVCECLGRLPEVAGSWGGVLGLLREELLRSVYVDPRVLARGGRPVDARMLLERPTYFGECAALRSTIAEQEQRLAEWELAKRDLAQDADGRNELLRLAASRWNTVLATIRADGTATSTKGLPETTQKLSALMDAMTQHSKALDELQRLALLDPSARMHSQFGQLGAATRKRLLMLLLSSHGGQVFASQEGEERLALLHALLVGLDLTERQQLVQQLVQHEGIVGSPTALLEGLLRSLTADEARPLLKALLEEEARRTKRPEQARAALRRFEVAALASAHPSAAASAEAEAQAGDGICAGRDHERGAQTLPALSHGQRAELLAEVAAEVGPEAVAALPGALSLSSPHMSPRRQRRSGESGSDTEALYDEQLGQYFLGRSGGSLADGVPVEARALLPLVEALEGRCAEQARELAEARAEIAKLRFVKSSI